MRVSLTILFACSFLLGCVKRTISITSNPSGALVWVNDREIGRTPVSFDFVYYGEYDLRLEGDGQEPLMTTAWTQRPFYDAPFLDFVSEVGPFYLRSNSAWHFELIPRNDDPDLLLQRAAIARGIVAGDNNE